MRLRPRSILPEEKLTELESKVQCPTYRTRGVFRAYRNAASLVRSAGRNGDKEAYQDACRRLEEERTRIDGVIRLLYRTITTGEKD